MVKMYTAITNQIDDPEAAAREIREQLDPEKNMLKNTLGIAAFYSEYGENGVYEAVAAALPFELTGVGSSYVGSCGQIGEFSLVVTMLTSDDVTFLHRSLSIENKSHEAMRAELAKIYAEFLAQGKPRMVLSYASTQPYFSGDELVDTANAANAANGEESILLFGTLAWSADGVPEKNFVAAGKKVSPYLISLVAVYGEVAPRFQVTVSLDYNALIKEAAVITSAEGPTLKEVSNIPAYDYLKKMGIVSEKTADTEAIQVSLAPAILIYENGARTARGFFMNYRADKSLLAAGNMPVGAKISFSLMNGAETIKTAQELVRSFAREKVRNSLNYSCAARALSLVTKPLAEGEAFAAYYAETIKNGGEANYLFCYSGGEICPVSDKDGKLVNCLHNYTLVSCTL